MSEAKCHLLSLSAGIVRLVATFVGAFAPDLGAWANSCSVYAGFLRGCYCCHCGRVVRGVSTALADGRAECSTRCKFPAELDPFRPLYPFVRYQCSFMAGDWMAFLHYYEHLRHINPWRHGGEISRRALEIFFHANVCGFPSSLDSHAALAVRIGLKFPVDVSGADGRSVCAMQVHLKTGPALVRMMPESSDEVKSVALDIFPTCRRVICDFNGHDNGVYQVVGEETGLKLWEPRLHLLWAPGGTEYEQEYLARGYVVNDKSLTTTPNWCDCMKGPPDKSEYELVVSSTKRQRC